MDEDAAHASPCKKQINFRKRQTTKPPPFSDLNKTNLTCCYQIVCFAEDALASSPTQDAPATSYMIFGNHQEFWNDAVEQMYICETTKQEAKVDLRRNVKNEVSFV
ncbi:unnamed protein product [Thlaspi arvense]|uniref:Uncharacterized protein n=1 Tax=Thlaspi arvense TaxID=13288 RepID=A0AAU9S995_THLAR|nr:unnamed protein product [Thlaspi arvense]